MDEIAALKDKLIEEMLENNRNQVVMEKQRAEIDQLRRQVASLERIIEHYAEPRQEMQP